MTAYLSFVFGVFLVLLLAWALGGIAIIAYMATRWAIRAHRKRKAARSPVAKWVDKELHTHHRKRKPGEYG